MYNYSVWHLMKIAELDQRIHNHVGYLSWLDVAIAVSSKVCSREAYILAVMQNRTIV